MEIQRDFKGLLEPFKKRGVECLTEGIANPRATGRAKDVADIEVLGEQGGPKR